MYSPVPGIPVTYAAVLLLATALLSFVAAAAYAARHAGIRTGLPGTAATVYGILALLGRVAGTLQAPLLNKSLEETVLGSQALGEPGLRVLLAASAAGTLFLLALYPTAVAVFERATAVLHREGTAPRMLYRAAVAAVRSPGYWLRGVRLLGGLRRLREAYRSHPGVLLGTVAVVAVNNASLYAAALAGLSLPEYRATCLSLTAVVNAGATVALSLLIDPQVASSADRALRGESPEGEFGDYTAALLLATVLGQVLSQAVLLPASWLILRVALAL